MNTIKGFTNTILFMVVFSFIVCSCEKDKHIPPDVSLKSGAGYTSGDATVAKSQAITVGIIAVKKEDDMLTYNVSNAYDGATTTTTFQTFSLAGAEQQNYSKDVTFTTRNQAGTEKWIFTITDKDGNIAQKQVLLTVQ
ncbi:MAG: hypothetical protein ABI760_16925 [Ferruginibacter sp.]